MNLVNILERTIGFKLAIKILISLPLLPKSYFLGAKVRYISRYCDRVVAKRYLQSIISEKIRISTLMQLDNILALYTYCTCEDGRVRDYLETLLKMLIEYEPGGGRKASAKIELLVKLFKFDEAEVCFYEYYDVISNEMKENFENYLKLRKDLISDVAPALEASWDNSLYFDFASEPGKKKIIFFFPRAFSVLNASCRDNTSIYIEIISFYNALYRAIPRDEFVIIPKIQSGVRFASEVLDDEIVVSYHTKGPSRNALRVKESAFSKYFTIDCSGFSGWHSLSDTSVNDLVNRTSLINDKDIDLVFTSIYSDIVVDNVSKYKQPGRSAHDLSGVNDYYFLPLQVVTDVVADLAYIGVCDLLKTVAEYCLRTSRNLVIKRHPRCESSEIYSLLCYYEGFPTIFILDDNIHNLIRNSKLVITVNSGVGFESLLHMKAVVTTGKSDYSCVTTLVKNELELVRELESPSVISRDIIKKYIYFFYVTSLYKASDDARLRDLWNSYV